MFRKSRLLAAALLALLALALASGAAGASRVGLSPGGAISMAGPMTVRAEMTTIRCNVTLRGTMSSALLAVERREAAGTITETATSECSGGVITVLRPAQIHINGELIVNGETLVGVLYTLESTGVLIEAIQHCLYGTTFGVLVGIVERRPGLATATYELLPGGLPLIRNLGIAPCIASATLSGSGTLSPTQTVTYLP